MKKTKSLRDRAVVASSNGVATASENENAPSVFPVADIDAATAAFPAHVSHLMPNRQDIPDEFKRHNGTEWNRLVSDWFYCGVKNLGLTPKNGIDKAKALRHVTTVMGSYEPKHEHKEAACAFLLSEWFTNPKWERAE